MENFITYNDYIGSVNYSADDRVFYGKIEFIQDLVTFEATTVNDLESAFRNAVNHYLQQCQKLNKAPQKTFKGRIQVTLDPGLYKRASLIAAHQKISLNQLVAQALKHEVEKYM